MSRNLVILAEKANAAEAYAEAIGVKNLHKNRDGFLEGEVSFSIGSREEPVHVEIVHSQGHCLRLLDPDEIDENYKKWDVAMLPIPFDDNKLKAIDDYKERKLNAIKKALGAADYIINAGDSGREGELIQRWILKEAGKGYVMGNALYRLKEALPENETVETNADNGVAKKLVELFL